MARDYKQQMWLMTDGLGEWMTRRELRRRRRRRVAMVIGAMVIVTLAVLGVVLLLFPRNVYHQHNIVNNYYRTETSADATQDVVSTTVDTSNGLPTLKVNGDKGESVRIGKNGIKVKDSDGEEVNISIDLEDLIKKYSKQ